MKTLSPRIILALLFIFTAFLGRSQSKLWRLGTALTEPKKELSFGIFTPLSYGLTSRVELQTHPIVFAAAPNIGVKVNWKKDDIYIATRHAIHYPTLGLGIAKSMSLTYPPFYNDGDTILPFSSEVPNLLVFTNEILFSTWLTKSGPCRPRPDNLLTLKIGLLLASNSQDTTLMPVFDDPIVFQRAATFYHKPVWYVGLDLDGSLFGGTTNFCVDIDFKSVNWAIEYWAIEHKALLYLPMAERMALLVGYKFSYGSYPTGNKIFVMPFVDFRWHIKFKTKKTKGEI